MVVSQHSNATLGKKNTSELVGGRAGGSPTHSANANARRAKPLDAIGGRRESIGVFQEVEERLRKAECGELLGVRARGVAAFSLAPDPTPGAFQRITPGRETAHIVVGGAHRCPRLRPWALKTHCFGGGGGVARSISADAVRFSDLPQLLLERIRSVHLDRRDPLVRIRIELALVMVGGGHSACTGAARGL